MNELSDTERPGFTRRMFLANASAFAAASCLGFARPVAAEPPPEVKKIRLVHVPAICLAPQYLAEELLHLEGFSEVEYVERHNYPARVVEAGEADFTQDAATSLLPALDSGKLAVALAGVHVGCFELVAHERIRAIRDLKGKTVAISEFGAPEHVLLASMLAYVGIDPRKDIKWAAGQKGTDSLALFIDNKADALMGFNGLCSATARVADKKDWARYRQYGTRPSVVPVFLLHGRRASGIHCQVSRRQQARAAGVSQSRRHLCSGSRASGKTPRGEGLRAALRNRPGSTEGASL
jgi:hypothetical protein